MLQRRMDLVLKLGAIDRGTAAAGAGGITTLNHEVGNDPVEGTAVVVAALSEGKEVRAGARSVVSVKLHGDAAHRGIEGNESRRHFGCLFLGRSFVV
jgi:dihydroorotase-like cyclic amidohydrolase